MCVCVSVCKLYSVSFYIQVALIHRHKSIFIYACIQYAYDCMSIYTRTQLRQCAPDTVCSKFIKIPQNGEVQKPDAPLSPFFGRPG